ncbi:MAG: hypothetical protein ACRD2I_00205 [Vicinamibacterales bacterium]
MVRKLLVLGMVATALLVPRAVFAITVDQVISLARSGATDTVILAMIDRDRTVFAIEPEQIAGLQRAGVSETVILAMLKSGREEGEQAARADSAYNSSWIASTLSTEPQSISVGHGPDRPNTAHIDGFYSGPPAGGFYVALPWARRSSRGHADRRRVAPAGQQPATVPPPVPVHPLVGAPPVDLVSSPSLCLAQISTQHSTNQPAFVTACPAVMQPRRR